jgi:hypothetical protein
VGKGGIPGWLKWLADQIVEFTRKPKKVKALALSLEDGTMQRIMTVDQKATIALEGVDSQGNPAPVVGVPSWTNSDPAVGSLQPAADGLSAVFTALAMGMTQVSASLGSIRAKEPIDFQVEAGTLSALVLTVGPNEPK